MDKPDLLADTEVMDVVYAGYPRKDKYDRVYGDGHSCGTKVIYCKGDWDIIRCELCGRECQVTCTFDEEYS